MLSVRAWKSERCARSWAVNKYEVATRSARDCATAGDWCSCSVAGQTRELELRDVCCLLDWWWPGQRAMAPITKRGGLSGIYDGSHMGRCLDTLTVYAEIHDQASPPPFIHEGGLELAVLHIDDFRIYLISLECFPGLLKYQRQTPPSHTKVQHFYIAKDIKEQVSNQNDVHGHTNDHRVLGCCLSNRRQLRCSTI